MIVFHEYGAARCIIVCVASAVFFSLFIPLDAIITRAIIARALLFHYKLQMRKCVRVLYAWITLQLTIVYPFLRTYNE